MTGNVQSNSLILVKKIITEKSPPFNLKLSSVMSLILTCIRWYFIWQLHYFLSILFQVLSPRFMKYGTYIAYHKTNLLRMAFIELLSSFHDEANKYIDFWSIFWKWWSIAFVVWLTKETLKILYSFRSIVRNSQHCKTPEHAETERRTNLADWNGVANSYLVCHGAIVFQSMWV